MSTDVHVVLGASGGAGNAIARALHDAGLRTRAVNRSGRADLPSGVETVAADITAPAGIDAALADSSVVYMAAQPAYHRWAEEFPSMLAGIVDGCAGANAKLVMVDNLYAYGPGHAAITPDSPHRAADTKGRVRQAMIDMLLEAHRSGRATVAIGQASDYFGPRSDHSTVTALAVAPAASKGSLRWMGSLDQPHSVAYLPDIARAHLTLGTSSAADGRVWVLPHGKPVTGAEFLAEVNAALGEQRKTGAVTKAMLRVAAPFSRISRESLGVLYQWTEPWIADDAAFQTTFGPFEATPLDVAVKESVEWYRPRSA